MVVDILKYLSLSILVLLGLYMAAKVITMGIMKGIFESKERRKYYGVKEKEKESNT